MGILWELLPWLERDHGQRPDVIVGALNAAYIAAKAGQDAEQVAADGARLWRPRR
jgi:hypothetical protein